ncbi:hypothetical protein RDWZM_003249 [Blomia tropicalis]|uniref:HECT-type E3 ubiquitin transferase n=1 Tax=Blomia tropicalis TaxID=40697 RepID=A0A9Q0MFQ0_BLOTA|nr:hypothetical protein RDWZM_003249 [Blomia tropicalis]
MTWPPPPELTFRTKEQVQDWVTKQPGGPQFWSGLRWRVDEIMKLNDPLYEMEVDPDIYKEFHWDHNYVIGCEKFEHLPKAKLPIADHYQKKFLEKCPTIDGPNFSENRAKLYDNGRQLFGWRLFITCNSSLSIRPRRLLYYHSSSMCFQRQNPALLHPDLFRFGLQSYIQIENDHKQKLSPWSVRFAQKDGTDGTSIQHYRPIFFNTSTKLVVVENPLEFKWKFKMFQAMKSMNYQRIGQLFFLDPDYCLDVTFAQFAIWNTKEFHSEKVYTKIAQEDVAIDVGGVTAAAIETISDEFLRQESMFKSVSGGMPGYDIYQISNSTLSDSLVNRENNQNLLKYFYLFGRFIAWVWWHGFTITQNLGPKITHFLRNHNDVPLECYSTKAYTDSTYDVLTYGIDLVDKGQGRDGVEIGLFYWSLESVNDVAYYLHPDAHPNSPNYDLYNLTDTKFTDEQKDKIVEECLAYGIDYTTYGSFYRQVNAIKNGFKDVIPLEWCRLFSTRELNLIIAGDCMIDLEEWERELIWYYDESLMRSLSNEIRERFREYFWSIFKQKAENDIRLAKAVLHFATNSISKPVGGNPDKAMKWHVRSHLPHEVITVSHTCFSTIDLSWAIYLELCPNKTREETVKFVDMFVNFVESDYQHGGGFGFA